VHGADMTATVEIGSPVLMRYTALSAHSLMRYIPTATKTIISIYRSMTASLLPEQWKKFDNKHLVSSPVKKAALALLCSASDKRNCDKCSR